VYRFVDPPNILLADQTYGDENVFAFDVRASLREAFAARLIERRLAILP
jgi:hypothetical protein